MKENNEDVIVVDETPVISILDYLKLMSENSSANVLSVKEIWDLIANKSSLSNMGFSSDDELKTFIEDNPYSSIS